ncbi:MAG: hypothetical protein ABW278_16810 [Steroidobacteraceae bacterium]
MNRLLARRSTSGRAQATWDAYDIDRRYGEYAEFCQAAFVRPVLPAPDLELEREGFRFLCALDRDIAFELKQTLLQSGPSELLKKDSPHLKGFRVTDRLWIEGLLEGVFGATVDSSLVSFFRSEYLVHWIALAVTRPEDKQRSVSFRWHCDKGPSSHLKLILYLNATSTHGGNTEFLNLADSNAVAKQGYLFGWSRLRTNDTRELSRLARRSLSPQRQQLEPGDAVLFQPARVLHRGVTPTQGDRLTATLCLLPSPVNWRQALRCGTMSDLASDEKWHDDAFTLQRTIAAHFPVLRRP